MAYKPCRHCKQPKDTKGWYCEPCDSAISAKRALAMHVCAHPDISQPWWMCEPCKAVRAAKQKEAARRGAQTRQKNNPHWARPMDAPRFWQSKAHSMVGSAIRHGILPKLDGAIACADCGAAAKVYEHRDYSMPLVVDPVCDSCNKHRGTAKWPTAADYNFKRITEHV